MMLTMILVLVVSHEPGHGHSGLEADPGKRQARLKPIPLMCPKWSQNQCLPKMPHLLWILCEKSQVKNHPLFTTVAGTEPGCLSATS